MVRSQMAEQSLAPIKQNGVGPANGQPWFYLRLVVNIAFFDYPRGDMVPP
jgi:hypothetical protein